MYIKGNKISLNEKRHIFTLDFPIYEYQYFVYLSILLF
jgi:hypothetical protein